MGERNYSTNDPLLEEKLKSAKLLGQSSKFSDDEVKAYRIFERFDDDGDGLLNYQELKELIAAVKHGDVLRLEAYIDICKTLEEDPALGITKEKLRTLYSSGYSNLDRD